MQVSANLGAGVADLNLPYFRLYRENLDNVLDSTRKHMAGRPGVCSDWVWLRGTASPRLSKRGKRSCKSRP